jgi:tryptophan halogenase
MQTTRSLGYVHSSSYMDANDAEAELRQFEGSHSDDLSTNLVKFRVGHRAAPWVGNCISIGLAAGFIEPLESTGLYLSHMAAVMLAEYRSCWLNTSPMPGTTRRWHSVSIAS